MKNHSITEIEVKRKDFFLLWLMFTRPMHKLTVKEMECLAEILYKRYELSSVIIEESTLNKYLFSQEVKKEMINNLGYKSTEFSILLTKFRKAGVLSNGNVINPKYIPDLSVNPKMFSFLINFSFKDFDKNIKKRSLEQEEVIEISSKKEEEPLNEEHQEDDVLEFKESVFEDIEVLEEQISLNNVKSKIETDNTNVSVSDFKEEMKKIKKIGYG